MVIVSTVFSNAKQILSSLRFDGIIVETPTSGHLHWTVLSLEIVHMAPFTIMQPLEGSFFLL